MPREPKILRAIVDAEPYIVAPASAGGRSVDWNVSKQQKPSVQHPTTYIDRNVIKKFEYKDEAIAYARGLASRQNGSGVLVLDQKERFTRFEPNPNFWSVAARRGAKDSAVSSWKKKQGAE